MKALVPCDEPYYDKTSRRGSVTLATGEVRVAHKHERRRRDLSTLSARGPCNECNSEWMNEIEGQARAALTAMIRDERRSISVIEQAAIATWISLKATVGEFLFEAQGISDADRKWFAENKRPYENSQVYVAHMPVGNLRREYHHSPVMGRKNAEAPAFGIGLTSVIQFGIVQTVFIYGPSAVVAGFRFPRTFEHRFDRIFPAQRSPVEWSPPYSLDLNHYQEMHAALDRFTGFDRVRAVPVSAA